MVAVAFTAVGLLLAVNCAQSARIQESSAFSTTTAAGSGRRYLGDRHHRSDSRSGFKSTHAALVLPFFGASSKTQRTSAKKDLLDAIKPLNRGLGVTAEDIAVVETLAQKLEKANPNAKSLSSPLINGRWELIYTTSESILGKNNPSFLRPSGPIYQDIDVAGLRAKNAQFLQPIPSLKIPYSVRSALTPTSASEVNVQFLEFKIGPIKIKAPKNAKGCLDTTYLDEEIRVGRGNKGNLFVLKKAKGLEPDFS